MYFQGLLARLTNAVIDEVLIVDVVVILSIKDETSFAEFENHALRIMAKHEGRLLSSFRPLPENAAIESAVREIHVLRFPDQDSFRGYQSDAELLELAELRQRAILTTQVFVSASPVDYFANKT